VRFPFPIPVGYYMLAYSADLAPGDVQPLHYFGRELVLFRTQSGRPLLFDAYCPHLGAHLGHGGRVDGERLRCPFHAWAYDASGRCIDVPYAERIPARARTRAWEVREHSGRIWAWHGEEGARPSFEVPEIPEELDAAWEPYKTWEWSIQSCLQELSENGADSAHFQAVHDMREVPEMNAHFEGPYITSHTPAIFPTGTRTLPGAIDVHSSGMGCDVIRYSGGCEVVEVVCTTPIDAERVHVRMSYRIPRGAAEEERAMSIGMADYVAWQFTKDIPIWENKRYRASPLLCEGDGPIGEFRRWCQQFYPEVGSRGRVAL
jgi:phenylpropionate dioxygenase-like ring-hydroxylating dioxygenase large terminal subunit